MIIFQVIKDAIYCENMVIQYLHVPKQLHVGKAQGIELPGENDQSGSDPVVDQISFNMNH